MKEDLKLFIRRFELFFGPETVKPRLFFAPGRVNLIGEHTDYTGGYVFPAALTFGTWAAVRPRNDRKVRLVSTSFDKRVECNLDELTYASEDDWGNYPKGVIAEYLEHKLPVSGFDVLYHGNIPNGAGLSSSASIELLTAVFLQTLFPNQLSRVQLVQISQHAENHFVGVNCGIMDQFAVGMGKKEHAVRLNCATLEYEYVPLVLGDYRLVVINSNKQRKLTESKYNERRSECEAGFAAISEALLNPRCLGEVSTEQYEQVKHLISSPRIQKRIQHVVTENYRVLASTDALRRGELEEFGKYMIQSHESLRDDYEVTGTELDTLVEESLSVKGCIGSRMTGAGFGGCTVSLVHTDSLEEFQAHVGNAYQSRTGLVATFYICEIGDGARELTEEVDSWQS